MNRRSLLKVLLGVAVAPPELINTPLKPPPFDPRHYRGGFVWLNDAFPVRYRLVKGVLERVYPNHWDESGNLVVNPDYLDAPYQEHLLLSPAAAAELAQLERGYSLKRTEGPVQGDSCVWENIPDSAPLPGRSATSRPRPTGPRSCRGPDRF